MRSSAVRKLAPSGEAGFASAPIRPGGCASSACCPIAKHARIVACRQRPSARAPDNVGMTLCLTVLLYYLHAWDFSSVMLLGMLMIQ